jgi:hypothetical protein
MHTQTKKPGTCECVYVLLHGLLCITYRMLHFYFEKREQSLSLPAGPTLRVHGSVPTLRLTFLWCSQSFTTEAAVHLPRMCVIGLI